MSVNTNMLICPRIEVIDREERHCTDEHGRPRTNYVFTLQVAGLDSPGTIISFDGSYTIGAEIPVNKFKVFVNHDGYMMLTL